MPCTVPNAFIVFTTRMFTAENLRPREVKVAFLRWPGWLQSQHAVAIFMHAFFPIMQPSFAQLSLG